jgi:predicted DNA-binding transcriptional regulator AlpA
VASAEQCRSIPPQQSNLREKEYIVTMKKPATKKPTSEKKLALLKKARAEKDFIRQHNPRAKKFTADDSDNAPPVFLDKAEVLRRVSLTYPMIWKWMREGTFPRSRLVGVAKTVWLESDIIRWMKDRPITKLKGDEGYVEEDFLEEIK